MFLPRIEMVGESYEEIVRAWHVLRREKQTDVVVMNFPPLDTRGKHTPIEPLQSDMMLEVFALVKVQEREYHHVLQAEAFAKRKSAV